jgi:DNA-binding response OmpR family regulator
MLPALVYGAWMARILVIEDDALLAEIVRDELTRNGYEVVVAPDGARGLAEFARREPHLVLLDLILPDRNGFAILSDLRASSTVPVIIVTSRDYPEEKVTGLDLGADDYITKPFRADELLARIRARLRSQANLAEGGGAGVRSFGNVTVDLGARTVGVEEKPAHLTPTEFKLLEYLLRRQGKAVRREQLIAALAGGEDATEQALQTHISRLRRKLGPDGDRILTVWGVGYRLDGDEGEPTRAR